MSDEKNIFRVTKSLATSVEEAYGEICQEGGHCNANVKHMIDFQIIVSSRLIDFVQNVGLVGRVVYIHVNAFFQLVGSAKII